MRRVRRIDRDVLRRYDRGGDLRHLRPRINVPRGACACDISGEGAGCQCDVGDLPDDVWGHIVRAKLAGDLAGAERIKRTALAQLNAERQQQRGDAMRDKEKLAAALHDNWGPGEHFDGLSRRELALELLEDFGFDPQQSYSRYDERPLAQRSDDYVVAFALAEAQHRHDAADEDDEDDVESDDDEEEELDEEELDEEELDEEEAQQALKRRSAVAYADDKESAERAYDRQLDARRDSMDSPDPQANPHEVAAARRMRERSAARWRKNKEH